MNKLLTLLLVLISSIAYSQSGVGYLNYTIYNTNGSSYRNSYPNSDADFVNLFNTSTGTTIYKSGTTTAYNALYYYQTFFTGVPNGAGYFGIQTTGWFVPKETGTYTFAIDGDDAVDFLLDGVVVTSFYGAHGFGGYRYGTINLVAGRAYTLKARFQQVGGGWGLYVIWKRPSQSTYSVQSDECYSTQPATPTKKAIANFNFNTNITPTTFSVGSVSLSATGSADITTNLDSNKVANGNYKMTLTPGQVEWVWAKALPFDRYGYSPVSIGVDLRKFNGIDPSKITSVKFLDGYDGDMTYKNSDPYWANYDVLSPNNLGVIFGTETNGYVGTSQYLSSIRNMGGGYQWGVRVDPALTPIISYKTQSVALTTTNNLTTLYNSIVTVTDVYLAFKELANGGLFGNQTGNEFVYGIQYKNADINDDGTFNEADCFLLLQNLTGSKALVDVFSLDRTMRIIPQTTYDNIGKSNWTTFKTPLGGSYSFDINTGKATDTFNYAIAWKGDVNLSHSTTPKSNGITTMSVPTTIRTMSVVSSTDVQSSIVTELSNGKVYAYLTFDPLQQNVVGTQFQLNYDNSVLKFESIEFKTKGSPMNFGTDKGTFINLGSLITDGSTSLDKTTEYKIIFTPIKSVTNTLGLLGIGTTDAVSKDGKQLKVKIN